MVSRAAARWDEALPVGNGRLGAMVFGGTAEERLQLNEDSLWLGWPDRGRQSRGARGAAEDSRLLFAGKYAEAQTLTNQRRSACPAKKSFGSYTTLGDLH